MIVKENPNSKQGKELPLNTKTTFPYPEEVNAKKITRPTKHSKVKLNKKNLLLVSKMKLKQIICNFCPTLSGEHKHRIFRDRHGKIATGRWSFSNLYNLYKKR